MMQTIPFQRREPMSTLTNVHSQMNHFTTNYELSETRAGPLTANQHTLYPHSLDCSPKVTVKEEPVDDEKGADLVIDLTPKSMSIAGMEGQYSKINTAHVQARPSPGDGDAPGGNVPSHVHDAEDDFSDCEMDSQDMDSRTEDQDDDVLTGTFRFSVPKNSMAAMTHTQPRAKREFVPEDKKDQQYWNKRHKNNISARRSRMKRKALEQVMEKRMVQLEQENIQLKFELRALKRMFSDRVDIELPTSPAGSPASSSSSGIGMSSSNLSSDGSTEHSASSSPALHIDEDQPKKPDIPMKAKPDGREYENQREDSEYTDQSVSFVNTGRNINPPAAHAHSSLLPAYSTTSDRTSPSTAFTPPAAHAHSSSHNSHYLPAHLPASINVFPPHAHSSSRSGPQLSHCNTATVSVLNEAPLHYMVPRPCTQPQLSSSKVYLDRSSPSNNSSSLSTNLLSSEDESNSSSGSRSNSQSVQDEKLRHHIPLKCRMKPGEHSAFHPASSAPSKNY